MQVFVALLLDANINIRCKAAGALQSLAVHPANQQVRPCARAFVLRKGVTLPAEH
jgi:hypothetical protein